MEIFKICLLRQLRAHPSMQPRDVVKLCYQAVFGAEHLLSDMAGAKRYFDEELAAVTADKNVPLYELISAEICRVNLAAWKAAGLDGECLFRMFANTAVTDRTRDDMAAYLSAAESVLHQCDHAFSDAAWKEYLARYIAEGMPAVRHTETYRKAEHPAYRIVHTKYLPDLQREAGGHTVF